MVEDATRLTRGAGADLGGRPLRAFRTLQAWFDSRLLDQLVMYRRDVTATRIRDRWLRVAAPPPDRRRRSTLLATESVADSCRDRGMIGSRRPRPWRPRRGTAPLGIRPLPSTPHPLVT